MSDQWTLDVTEMDKEDLLKVLRANRKKHKKEFVKTRKAWRKKVIKALKKAADAAAKDTSPTLPNGVLYPTSKLPKPEHHLNSYDDMIERLERDRRDTVQLTNREFKSYVQDKWDWHDQWVGTQSLYSNSR